MPMDELSEDRFKVVHNRLDKLELALEKRDDKVYRRINEVAESFRSDIYRLQNASDAKFERLINNQNQQFQGISQQLGSITARLDGKPDEGDVNKALGEKADAGDVTQAKISIMRLKEKQRVLEKERALSRSKFDPRRFMREPWAKMIAAIIGSLLSAAGCNEMFHFITF